MKKIWKPIIGFEDYYKISNTGLVKSLRSGKIRSPSHQKTGYLQITLCINGKSYYRYIHRLVAQHFNLQCENENVVNHKDGNKHNNNFNNLEWCTDAQNNYHAGQLNLKPIGTNHTNSKFTKKDLEEIEKLDNSGFARYKIAKKFKVHRKTVENYLNGRTYKKEILNVE